MIVLFICYFGNFPNYFQLWLNSCAKSKKVTWIIFTDNTDKYIYPENVKVINLRLKDIELIIRKKTQINAKLNNPYKLCDFRPLYGLIFDDYCNGYSHWGYCDIDLIFGNLDKFLTNEILNLYDVIFTNGHLTILKNSIEIKNLFKKRYSGIYYRTILESEYHFGFDEYKGLNLIVKENNVRIYDKKFFADIDCHYFNFMVLNNGPQNAMFKVEKNGLFCLNDKKEYMYIHLQKRKLNIDHNLPLSSEEYFILPNVFTLDKDHKEQSSKILYRIKITKKVLVEKIRWNFHWKIKWLLRPWFNELYQRGESES